MNTPQPPQAFKGNVMIVDDETPVRNVVCQALTHKGYTVTTASNGLECLEAIRAGFRGVILMDVMMPQLDGWDTIERIVTDKLLEGNVICMLTGNTELEERGVKLECYVMDFLAKPFTAERLYTMVQSAFAYLRE